MFPYIATVAETRFSTTAAIVTTGAITWKPGLRYKSLAHKSGTTETSKQTKLSWQYASSFWATRKWHKDRDHQRSAINGVKTLQPSCLFIYLFFWLWGKGSHWRFVQYLGGVFNKKNYSMLEWDDHINNSALRASMAIYHPISKARSWNRPIRLTQCCNQFKSPGVKILCVLYLYQNVAFTFKWYGNSRNKTFYSQRVWIGYNIELAE